MGEAPLNEGSREKLLPLARCGRRPDSRHQIGAPYQELDENDLDSSIFDGHSDLERVLSDNSQNWLYIEIKL